MYPPSSLSQAHPSLSDFRAALHAFQKAASNTTNPNSPNASFRVLYTFPALFSPLPTSSSYPSSSQPSSSLAAAAPFVPYSPPTRADVVPKKLYVLDSSFNPPTRAHFDMALSALREDDRAEGGDGGGASDGKQDGRFDGKRLLLLLAVKNADKAPQPAPFEHRLVLMCRFARDIRAYLMRRYERRQRWPQQDRQQEQGQDRAQHEDQRQAQARDQAQDEAQDQDHSSILPPSTASDSLPPTSTTTRPIPAPATAPTAATASTLATQIMAPPIDIGVTVFPYFHDKAAAIDSSDFYRPESHSTSPTTFPSISSPVNPAPSPSPETTEQIYLLGHDTLTRFLNPRYYPPRHSLDVLAPFFTRHRLRVTYRADGPWGDRHEQERYLLDLRDGKREQEGGRREWAARIALVELGPGKEEEDGEDGEEGGDVGARERNGDGGDKEPLSSTTARQLARQGDEKRLKRLVTREVAEWVLSEKLYAEDPYEDDNGAGGGGGGGGDGDGGGGKKTAG